MKNEYDLLKVFAILLVVLGHITNLYDGGTFSLPLNNTLIKLTSVIYLFHMPLFVAISGAIFNVGLDHGKYQEFIPFVKNKFKRILFPFLIIGAFILAPVLIILEITELSYIECACEIIFGGTLIKHLWYLPSLFWIFIFVGILHRSKLPLEIMFILSIIITVLCSMLLKFNNPLCLWNAMQYLPYFIGGMLLDKYKENNNIRLLLYGSVLFTFMFVIIKKTSIALFDNVCCLLMPCGIIMALIAIARMIVPIKEITFLSWLLKQSFAVYLFHIMIIYVLYKIIGTNVPTIIMVPLTFILSIIISYSVAYLIRCLRLQCVIGEK